MKMLADEWADFERIVVPANASPAQRREIRRCFYAGASAMLHVQGSVTPDDVSESQGAAIMKKWADELTAFGEDMKAGRA